MCVCDYYHCLYFIRPHYCQSKNYRQIQTIQLVQGLGDFIITLQENLLWRTGSGGREWLGKPREKEHRRIGWEDWKGWTDRTTTRGRFIKSVLSHLTVFIYYFISDWQLKPIENNHYLFLEKFCIMKIITT